MPRGSAKPAGDSSLNVSRIDNADAITLAQTLCSTRTLSLDLHDHLSRECFHAQKLFLAEGILMLFTQNLLYKGTPNLKIGTLAAFTLTHKIYTIVTTNL
jgi:hypothetical protein